jgi:hypothetical protein
MKGRTKGAKEVRQTREGRVSILETGTGQELKPSSCCFIYLSRDQPSVMHSGESDKYRIWVLIFVKDKR